MVLVDESAEDLSASDAPCGEGDYGGVVAGSAKVQASVGPCGVVVRRVLVQHGAQVAFTEDQHPVGALGSGGAYPAFREGVHLRRLWGGLEDLDAVAGEHRVEGLGELGVAVPDQEAERVGAVPELEEKIAGLLGDPVTGGMRGNAEDVDCSGADLHHEEDVQALQGDRAVNVEEVSRQQGVGLRVQERTPGVLGRAGRRGWDLVAA